MACPNITSPEWKALVSAIGVDNAWKEFLIHGKIPDASIYNVEETEGKNVLYSIKTKTTAQLAKGIDKDLIKSQREIKYTSFILTGLLNAVGDLTPGKTLSKTPDQAFSEIKDVYTKLRDSINMSLESFIKSDSDLKDIKNSPSFLGEDGIAKHFPVLEWVKTYDELLNAKETFEDIISKWDRYKNFVEASLPSKGLQIVKNKIQPVDLQDKEDNDQDETEDVSIPNSEINSQKFDASIFETNPYDTATVRVRAMMQTIGTGEFEFGIPIYADPTDVMDDMLYAGVSMNLSNFTDKDSKLEQFRTALSLRQDGRPYISKLLNKIEAAEKKGDWEIINQILTFVSKAFANEEILLYTLNRSGSKVNGLTGSKIIGGNRDTIVEQIKRDWLAKHQISGFYNKSADGKLTPNSEKLEKLNTIRQEGKLLTGDAQKQKFIEYFKVLGVPFTMKDLEIISPKISTLFRKGKDFSIVFQDKNLLDNIYTNFTENLNVPFEGQYGFQNEGREMGLLAQLYFDANPNLYKAGATKTADGKTKYLYIQTNSAEISKREFQNTDGTGVTNTALAQPNSGEDSFWKKVKQNIYRFTLGYFNGSREQEIGKEGKVRKNFTEKEQLFNMIASHQADMNYGTYTTFTLSDKTTSLQTKMTKEFFVDTPKIPVGLGKDFIINNNEIEYTNDLKDRIYNSFVEPEISRILSAMKYSDSINLENFNIASKLFYFIPRLNSDPALEDFRKDLYSGKFTINQLNTKYSKTVADIILNEFTNSAENEVNKFIENGIIEINKNNNYEFPLYRNVYVNKFRQTKATNRNLAVLMSMDMKLNYMNSQIKTIQFLKFDPMHSFKASKGVTIVDFNKLSGEDKIKLVKSTWDEFSKRAAALIAPGSQGNWTWKYGDNKTYGVNQTYRTVTLKDVKKSNDFFKDFEPTDAQEFVTMQEHIDYLMSEGRIPLKIWEDIHAKIEKAGKGGYYELTKEELGYTLNPMKPVYAGSSKEGNDEAGLNRYDYVKSSRFPLIPQHEAGSERDKLRIWMEKNDIQSANFKSAKKLGRPSLSVEVFDENNNFIEPVDFEKGLQELSRDGLRNQQEIPHQKTQVSTVTQMNRTLFDGLLESVFNFSGLSNVSGTEMKSIKEALRAKMFDNAADKLKEKVGNLHVSNRGLYKLLEETIKNDTTGSYTANDLKSLALNDQGMFEIPLEGQFKFPKFQGLINSMINKNVMLKVEGTSFVQVSGVGAKFNFKDLSKGIKSDIIWTDKFAKTFKDGEVELKYVSKDKQGNVQPAQVIVSQYLKDEEGNLIDLNDFITEKNGVKILDTSRLSPEMLQLIASRIPNQSHVSMLPVEVVGFLPSYMENTIIVPDGITGQMGSDFDVDKLFAYTSKIIKGEDSEGKATYGPVQYTINSIIDISSLNENQISQAYRDIHWNVLTHEDTFKNITKSVDNPEVKEKVSVREKQLEKYGIIIDEGSNLPLDYQTSITRFMDNKSSKDGVSIFANLISAQADLQDKPLTLGKIDNETKKPIYNPIKIKLNKDGDIIDLLYIGNTGSSKSFLGEKRSISDNLNIMFTESVDNAKNQFLREFNWDNKSMGSMGMLSMLTDEKGQAVPIEFMMDFTSQPAIKDLLGLIDLKQDSFGNYDSDALRNGIVELQEKIEKTIDGKRFLKPGEQAGTYLTSENRSKELDPQTLANMWLIGKAIKGGADRTILDKISKDLKYKSVEDMLLDYYTVQYDSLELFQRLNDLGRELMTMLGSMYTYTKGIGGTIFSTKQKLNQLNKLAGSENFLGIENLAGSVSKSDTGIISIIPKGELGSSINNSLIEAQRIYGYLFPISTGKNLEEVVVRLLDGIGVDLNNASANKYEDTFNNVFKSTMQYLYTHPDLELFEDVRETRNRLINGDNSLATRITNLKADPNWAKNGFIKNLQVEPKWNSNIQTISFKAPFGTQINGDAVENGFYELATYKGENEEEIRSIAKDLVLYVYSTGDAGFMGSKIPIDYVMSDKEFARGIRRIRGTYNENMFKDDVKQNLIDQIVQNNPEEYSKKFSFFSSDDYENNFKKLLKPLIGNSSSLADVSKFTITRGNFKDEQGIVDALSIPLTESEIAAAKLEGLDPYKITGNKIETKAKYPPYILISDTFKSNYDDSNDRNVKYLYKRTSKALNERGDATYERINILGTSGIKEYDANPDNSDLKSVIKNNNVDAIVDPEMLPDDITTQPSTQPSNVKPTVKDLSRWADIKDAKDPYTDKGIVVTRVGTTDNQFGNPFIGSKRRDKQGNLVESKVDNITVFNTIDEADQAYRDWLMGTKHQNIKPIRREWILKQINEGKLDGKTLLYYKPMEVENNDGTIVKGGYHSHADTLAEIVEELRGTQPSTSVKSTREYTPEKITKENMPANGLFVFGSNNKGVHGLGAAKTAVTEFGAIRGQASGQQGKSFAVRTKMYQDGKLTIYNELTEDNKKEMDKMTIEDLNKLRLAAIANPNNKYYVTEIGTKLAGRSVEQMKDLFKRMNNKFGIPDNIILPQVFEVRDVQSTPIGSKEEKNINPLVEAGIKPTDMYGNAAKDIQMASESTQFIGFGTIMKEGNVSSTDKYAKAWGSKANTGEYTADDTIMVSGSGNFGRGGVDKTEEAEAIKKTLSEKYKPLLDKAIAAGASFRIGNQYAKGNLSDQLVAEYLQKKGYTEEKLNGYSKWTSPVKPLSTEQKISEPIVLDYKGTNYILEGSDEEGYQVYTISGGKKSRLLTNKKLASNIELSYQISQHPERVVTLTDIQHSPSYYVTPLGEILALASSNFGNQITSESVHKKVMSKINDQNEIVEEPVEEPIIEPKPEQKKEEIVDTNKKEIKVPAGSNPNNNVIMETADAIYLMNDGQQKAFDSIGKKVSTIISTRKKLEPSDFGENVKFNNNLSSKFNNLIPTAMWNNMIGLAGRGGVGKTTVIKAIIESLQKNKYSSPSVLYIAPSHTACTVLQESLGLDSEKANDDTVNTLASHLRKRPNQFNKFELVSEFDYIKSTKFKPAFGSPDIIIIDESSMIGQGDIKDMVQRLYTDFNNGLISRMPVFIFMGDYRQLGPINEKQNDFVNKGVISSTLFLDESKTDELTQVMRSDNAYLHQIYDSVGEQIIKNMEKTKNNQNPERPSLSKYDALTNKSTSNILVVNNERGVIQDYVDYLATNNNPYGMFWIHYNNSTNPVTKTLNESIRKEYFRKIGLSPVAPSHRLYAIGDYVENISPLELTLKNYPGYNTTDENIIKILKNNKNTYNKSTESYTLSGGTIKPNARFKVLDIVESKDSLRSYLNPIIGRFISDKDDAVDVETTIVYNRQNKIRAVPKVLNLAVSFGKYNNASKKQEGITITNYKTNTVIAKFDLPYGAYLDVVENLKMLDTSQGVVSDFIPSYVGSSHTAQGNSIKNVIVGEANIKKAANNGQTNIDDVLSSLYVALTRSSGTLTIVKSSGSPIENNQDVYMGAITDTNNAVRPVSSLQLIDSNIEETSLGADVFNQLSEEEVEFDFTELIKDNIKIEVVKEVFGDYENATFDTKTILNKVLKDTTQLNKQILSLISNTGGIGGLKIVLDKRIENPGEYDSNTKTIRINPDLSINEPNDEQDAKKQLHEVIMHELLHHITTSLLNTNPALLTSEQRKWVVALKTLFKSTQEKILKDGRHSKSLQEAIDAVSDENGFLSASDKSMYYGLTSVDEFVSMLITDEGFREFMNNTTYEGDKSIFDKFIEILSKILKALGIQVNDESVLKEGLTNIIGLIESRAENRNAEEGTSFRSITTESNKTKLIKENFESIIKTLNIKTQC